ncbi:hypothetical protein NDU88_005231 [Pleurodeles waltl]|uniref:Uncharacterized protein n=1 Tax=Pleurodeles waltl TaxID=8319 RepID=A0AAV7QI90_PLEWA|nr:hypothetical protein NDU88_005231 [Pleurodeles waltl]
MVRLASGGMFILKDAIVSDQVEKMLETAVKRYFVIRIKAYATYTIRSLIHDVQAVAEELQQDNDSTSRLAILELLSYITFDSVYCYCNIESSYFC